MDEFNHVRYLHGNEKLCEHPELINGDFVVAEYAPDRSSCRECYQILKNSLFRDGTWNISDDDLEWAYRFNYYFNIIMAPSHIRAAMAKTLADSDLKMHKRLKMGWPTYVISTPPQLLRKDSEGRWLRHYLVGNRLDKALCVIDPIPYDEILDVGVSPGRGDMCPECQQILSAFSVPTEFRRE